LKFEVLFVVVVVVVMSLLIFWVVVPGGHVDSYQHCRGMYFLHLQGFSEVDSL
jgi:hypothetical protein